MLTEAGVGGEGVGEEVGEGVGAKVGTGVGKGVGAAVGEGVGAAVGGGAGVDTGSHSFHPRLVTLKSDDHTILDDGVHPDGRRRLPLYFRPSIKR
jgi:hypothetical protein